MYPTTTQSDTPMSRANEQILSHQGFQIFENSGVAGRMQAVAAVIDGNGIDLETAGIASDVVSLFEHHGCGLALARKLPCGTQSGGPGTEDGDDRLRHGVALQSMIKVVRVSKLSDD